MKKDNWKQEQVPEAEVKKVLLVLAKAIGVGILIMGWLVVVLGLPAHQAGLETKVEQRLDDQSATITGLTSLTTDVIMLEQIVEELEEEVADIRAELEVTQKRQLPPDPEPEEEKVVEPDPEPKEEKVVDTTPKESTNGRASDGPTMGERNALDLAHSYLSFMAFSRTGLIRQLEYEGFSNSEAVYAVDNCGADWYEQAVLCAKSYLSFMSFSRDGLIRQLEYEGFTTSQAQHAVRAVGY